MTGIVILEREMFLEEMWSGIAKRLKERGGKKEKKRKERIIKKTAANLHLSRLHFSGSVSMRRKIGGMGRKREEIACWKLACVRRG